ncbi:MAG: hypothetical protein ACFHVJ_09495 [Aestuariibacter sp.]
MLIDEKLVQQRLRQIRTCIENNASALALFLPQDGHSFTTIRQNDSDISFTLVVETNTREPLIRDLSWLSDIQHIAFKYQCTDNSFRFIFSDGIYCHLSIVEESDFEQISTDMACYWCRRPLDKALPKLRESKPAHTQQNVTWLLGEVCTHLLTGLRCWHKGDKLSAFYYVQHYALGHLLTLIDIWEFNQQHAKKTSLEGGLEKACPIAAKQVSQFALGYDRTPHAAMAMLDYIEQHQHINFFLKDQIQNLLGSLADA